MVTGAAGAAFVGASTRGDQGGVLMSGWRRRSILEVRQVQRRRLAGDNRSGINLDRFLVFCDATQVSLMPWSAAAGEGPALLCCSPPHCRPCSGVGLDVADVAGCLEPEQ
jgi:hypothetical protein